MQSKYNRQKGITVNKKDEDKTPTVVSAERYVGPLPPASEFAKYKEVIPDMPERILKVFEDDSAHTREMNKTALDGF